MSQILSHLLALYSEISEATKSNPILAGAVSLWGLGVVTVICRHIPAKIWMFLTAQCTTTLVLNNTGYWGNREVFIALLSWYGSSKHTKWSRFFSLERKDDTQGIIIGPGYGNHYLFHSGSLFRLHKAKLDSTGTERLKEEITITMLGRNQKRLRQFIESFRPPEADDNIYAYRLETHGEWNRSVALPKRPWESIVAAPALLNGITKQMDEFYAMRTWYIERGLNHKIAYMLHGMPGCGKTSLVKALATKYCVNLYILNINAVSDTTFERALYGVPKGAFLLLEDIDSTGAVKDRISETNSGTPGNMEEMLSSLSLTGVLNALDGAIPLDNIVIFMTTNHIEKLDKALLRAGRTDHIVELTPLADAEIKKYIEYAYNYNQEFDLSDLESRAYSPIPGCDLQSVLLKHKLDYISFKKEIDDKYLKKESTFC